MHRHGLTIIEMLIVVAVLAILAVLVVPVYNNLQLRSDRATLQMNLRQMQQQIELHRNRGDGTPPETIEPGWFRGRQIPEHPQKRWDFLPDLEVATGSARHPEAKVLKPPPDRAAYWYNKDLGIVRARVTKVPGHWDNTMDFYNSVHYADEDEVGPLGKGGGEPGGGTGGGPPGRGN